MSFEFNQNTFSAKEDFRRARRRSSIHEIVDQLKGKSTDLLSYDDVVHKLKGQESSVRELKDIPIKAIVGSVGRYRDFNREFLPRKGIRAERWARVKMAMTGLQGVPPIEVYQIGEAYFVKDGNHRVSVAREMGFTHFQAFVTPVKTKVKLTPNVDLDELIIQSEFSDFLSQTKLDQLRPEADLRVTVPGEYAALLEHIKVHRYFMGIDEHRAITYQEAVEHWYDSFYLPIVDVIHKRGLLREFQGRTATDLYLFITQHMAELEKSLGWEVSAASAASNIEPRSSGYRASNETSRNPVSASLESQTALFKDILVTIDGCESGWNCFDHAALIGQREDGARIQGLHVVKTKKELKSELVQTLQHKFSEQCTKENLPGRLAIEAGDRIKNICQRARYTDITVVCVSTKSTTKKLGDGVSKLLRSCPRPILVMPESTSPLDKILLAFDGGDMAHETLYMAAYLASHWKVDLTVLTAHFETVVATRNQQADRKYLEANGIHANYVIKNNSGIVDAILATAKEQGSNLIVMGTYGQNAPWYVNAGIAVTPVLQKSNVPVLICG